MRYLVLNDQGESGHTGIEALLSKVQFKLKFGNPTPVFTSLYIK